MKKLFTLFIILSLCPPVFAQFTSGANHEQYRNSNRDTINGIHLRALNNRLSPQIINGLSLSFVRSYYSEFRFPSVNGLNLSVFNVSNVRTKGVSISLVNMGHRGNGGWPSVDGLSVSALNLIGRPSKGLSISLANFYIYGTSSGCQIALLNAHSSSRNMVQLGLINFVDFEQTHLLQIGLFNFNFEDNFDNEIADGLQLGLINYKRKGRLLKVMPLINF